MASGQGDMICPGTFAGTFRWNIWERTGLLGLVDVASCFVANLVCPGVGGLGLTREEVQNGLAVRRQHRAICSSM